MSVLTSNKGSRTGGHEDFGKDLEKQRPPRSQVIQSFSTPGHGPAVWSNFASTGQHKTTNTKCQLASAKARKAKGVRSQEAE